MHADDIESGPPGLTVLDLASFIGTLGGIVLLVGAFLVFDVFLARIDLRESERQGASEYRRGTELLAAHDPRAAADHFSAALVVDRNNVNYALALGEAQRQSGKSADAEETLRTLLERAENDGAVNLELARVLAEGGRVPEAKAYFHRALYGRWGADSLARRAEARFALIGVLAAHGGGRDLLAELLPLEDVSPDSIALRKRLGHWFLLAGSPVRAANMFREVLRRAPDDRDGYTGMGEAALAQGNFRTARADFSQAMSLAADDTLIAARLALVDTLLEADPLARGIGTASRVDRSRRLIARMLVALRPCIVVTPRAIADSAQAAVADTVGTGASDEIAVDALTTIASDLWTAYAGTCAAGGSDPVIPPIVARLAQ